MKAKMNMSKGSKILLLLAIVVSVLTGVGMYTYLSNQTVTVYLFAQDYEHGTPVSKDMFASYGMQLDLYNAMAGTGNAYVTAEEIQQHIAEGDALLVDVAQYTPVTRNQFRANGGTAVETRLEDDMVAVELPVDKVSGLGGELRVGSHINITTGYTIDSTKYTDLIFQNLLVVDLDYEDDGHLRAAYVEVKPEESMELMHAISFEIVQAAIVKPDAYETVTEDKLTYSRSYRTEEGASPSGIPTATMDAGAEPIR